MEQSERARHTLFEIKCYVSILNVLSACFKYNYRMTRNHLIVYTAIQNYYQQTQSSHTNTKVTAATQRSRVACKSELTRSKHAAINMPDAVCSRKPKLPQSLNLPSVHYSFSTAAHEGTNHCIQVTASRSSIAFAAHYGSRNG